ncbi:MAG: chaperonin GroEL [Polyangiales bacterium]
MSHTEVLFGDASHAKVLKGATLLADAVRLTLGPRSKAVLIGKKWGAPHVCDDGVTVAKQLKLKDPVEDLGAQMLKQAAERTGEAVGDGTSTSTILAHALYAEGLRNVVAGASSIELKRAFDGGLELAVAELRAQATKVDSKAQKAQVASVSAHGDKTIGEMVAEAIERVGSEGVVTVEESRTTQTLLEVVEGMQFDRGYISPYFVTNPEKMTTELDDPLILLSDKKVASMRDLVPLLEQIAKSGTPLLIVAEDVEGDALATLVVNKLRGLLPCAAVKAPAFGDRRKAILEDIGILTGGSVVTEELGVKLENVMIHDLGRAKKVILDKDTTTIVGGQGDAKQIEGRIAEIRRQMAETTSDYDKEKLQERLAKLAGGVAVVRVGAPTEAELKNRKDAFDDAIRATQAAVAEGIVPGGGVALVRAVAAIEKAAEGAESDRRTGLRILARALEAPLRQIAVNSQADPGVVVERVRGGQSAFGFDAAVGRFVDMNEAGILDPLKVVRIALENAVSVAGTLLLADATMVEIEEESTNKGAAGMGGGEMM